MNKSPSVSPRVLAVSIVAGPSRSALLQQIRDKQEKRCSIFPASALSQEGEQALEQINAIVEDGAIDHLIIECDSQMPPMAYASLFQSPPLNKTARLTKTVLAIRSSDLLHSLIRHQGAPEVESSCFLAEQLEFASHIVLDEAKDDPELKLARAVAITLNPRAQVSDLSNETIHNLLGAAESTSFDFAAALDGAGWRQLIDAEQTPSNGEKRIASFAYRARRPFHPERFWKLLQADLPGVFRAKGFFWLATRMDLVGGLNFAGSELHCAGAGQWWAARDEQARQHEMPERTRKEWQQPFGDRRQAIAFMGLDLDATDCKAQLDACLLTDAEMSAGREAWQNINDPFPSWSAHSHTHECDHDHESGDHECCHH